MAAHFRFRRTSKWTLFCLSPRNEIVADRVRFCGRALRLERGASAWRFGRPLPTDRALSGVVLGIVGIGGLVRRLRQRFVLRRRLSSEETLRHGLFNLAGRRRFVFLPEGAALRHFRHVHVLSDRHGHYVHHGDQHPNDDDDDADDDDDQDLDYDTIDQNDNEKDEEYDHPADDVHLGVDAQVQGIDDTVPDDHHNYNGHDANYRHSDTCVNNRDGHSHHIHGDENSVQQRQRTTRHLSQRRLLGRYFESGRSGHQRRRDDQPNGSDRSSAVHCRANCQLGGR